ncbi:MAG TPA: FAD-dependent monooxygenase, partial [Phycisphaerae bacterium]|nr:FAD-dependent monooxygenase [Phycisphaerae bacterium]
ATRVLRRMGVLDELVRHAHVPPAGALRDKGGKQLVRMAALETDAPTVFAHRAELHRALLRAIPPETLHLNRLCASVQRQGNQVRALFADGSHTEWADGLIGADGIRSAVREATLADGAPTYRGYVAWRGVADFPSAGTGGEIVGETWGRGQRFGFIPLGKGRAGWWATANKPGHQRQNTCAETQAQWKKELRARFGTWHAPIPKLLEETPESAILCNAIMDRTPPKVARPWGEGPLTLLGDAAHPTTPNLGQGACMAIEDAAVLAHAMAEIPDIAAAFRAYERARYARTAKIARESLKLGAIGQWENGLACAVRNFLVRLSPRGGIERQFRELWFYDAWNAPVEKP